MFFFFFSSRRRHTRYIGDWSSDVCSSDLTCSPTPRATSSASSAAGCPPSIERVRSEERRVGKSVDLGGRRIIKKKKTQQKTTKNHKKKQNKRTNKEKIKEPKP